MGQRTLTITENESRVLKILLSVDLDALGLERRDQGPARSVLRKLKAAEGDPSPTPEFRTRVVLPS